jgi:hypothetical protein
MPALNPNVAVSRGQEYENLLAKLFQRAGGRVERQPEGADAGVDLIAQHGPDRYVIQLKVSSEARKDRAIPLMSQAILEAQAAAQRVSGRAIPVAVLAVDHASESLAKQVKQFAERNAPNVAIGLIDADGFRDFAGHGLEWLSSERSGSGVRRSAAKPAPSSYLFSDLNQWMLKVLLSQDIPESMLSAPRGSYENASQLAEAAGVSVMSAFRFVRQLSREGFLEENGALRLVRIEELLQRWLGANQRRIREIPVRWIIRGESNQIEIAVRSYVSRFEGRPARRKRGMGAHSFKGPNRVCLGLFAAAEAFGLKFVHGSVPHIYLERFDRDALAQLGMSVEDAEHRADALVRIPENPESVFRAAVNRDGVPISDILQVWLEVSHHPARGPDQAKIIAKRILAKLFNRRRA